MVYLSTKIPDEHFVPDCVANGIYVTIENQYFLSRVNDLVKLWRHIVVLCLVDHDKTKQRYSYYRRYPIISFTENKTIELTYFQFIPRKNEALFLEAEGILYYVMA